MSISWKKAWETVWAILTSDPDGDEADRIIAVLHAEKTAPLAQTARVRLKDRRRSVGETILFQFSSKVEHTFEVRFGLDDDDIIREVFCEGTHTQSHLQVILEDGCIALSICLQHGARIGDLAKSFGELRDEGEETGLPSSPLGAIARAGAVLEADLAEGRW